LITDLFYSIMIANNTTPVPFEAYSGEGSYTFVSYAHADKAFVYECMDWLRKQGVDMWYDEGIAPAGEWVEEIASAIKGAKLFIVFISPDAVESRYVRSEVGYALSLDKDILSIYLKETDLPAGLDLCLQPFQSIQTSDTDWRKKAKHSVLDLLGKTEPRAKVIGVSSESITKVDVFEVDLWPIWDAASEAQRRRILRRLETTKDKVVPVLPQEEVVPVPPEEDDLSQGKLVLPAKPPSDLPIARKSRTPSNTRIPVALEAKVEARAESEPSVPEAHKDILDSDYSWIPSGSLTVWVPYANEARSVDMHEGFWMAQHIVTQESYTSVMGQNPSHIDDGEGFFRENLPVNNVSWLDAVSFCKAMTNLGKRHDHLPKGYEYRLPSEVEWEYACRGGSATDYYFGDDPTDLVQHAWFKNNSNKHIHPVGLKQPNPWGLYDLYGNIREWVGNSFVNTLLGDSEQDEFRISRGGGYMKSAAECKSSSRSTNSLYHRFRNLGFRVVLAKVS
jgi:hypothetical protein